MTIEEFEDKVKEIADGEHYAAGFEEYRRRGARIVTWSAYTERAGWVGIGNTKASNDAVKVLAELKAAHLEGKRVQHVA